MTVNSVFESGNNMTPACSPIETYEVSQERDRFVNGLSEWLSKYTS